MDWYETPGFIAGMVILAILCVYSLISFLFRRNPQWLHNKKKNSFSCLLSAHRGGAGENLEGTMTAFHHAMSVGADLLELDVHMTKDEVLVIAHDDTLLIATGQDKLISKTLFGDLPPLKPPLKLPYDLEHETFGSEEDRRIVRLEEVFETFPDVAMSIEFKEGVLSDAMFQKTCDLIVQYKREERTVWGSESNDIASKLYKLNPRVPLMCSVKRAVSVILLYYSGLLPFVPIKESAFTIMMPSAIVKGFDNCGERTQMRLADPLVMNKKLFRHLQARGIKVTLWVLNEEKDFERAFGYGADGIITDFPTRLRSFIDNKTQYEKLE